MKDNLPEVFVLLLTLRGKTVHNIVAFIFFLAVYCDIKPGVDGIRFTDTKNNNLAFALPRCKPQPRRAPDRQNQERHIMLTIDEILRTSRGDLSRAVW